MSSRVRYYRWCLPWPSDPNNAWSYRIVDLQTVTFSSRCRCHIYCSIPPISICRLKYNIHTTPLEFALSTIMWHPSCGRRTSDSWTFLHKSDYLWLFFQREPENFKGHSPPAAVVEALHWSDPSWMSALETQMQLQSYHSLLVIFCRILTGRSVHLQLHIPHLTSI